MHRLGRVATWVAAGALLLNALLLGAAGAVAGRPALLVAAGITLAAAGAVLIAWRRHLRTLARLESERHAVRDEALALRELLRGGPR